MRYHGTADAFQIQQQFESPSGLGHILVNRSETPLAYPGHNEYDDEDEDEQDDTYSGASRPRSYDEVTDPYSNDRQQSYMFNGHGRRSPSSDDDDSEEESVMSDKRDLDWATVLKRTFESYVRGERPNMYGEWLQW